MKTRPVHELLVDRVMAATPHLASVLASLVVDYASAKDVETTFQCEVAIDFAYLQHVKHRRPSFAPFKLDVVAT